MRLRAYTRTQEVAGGRLATSAQPHRATFFFHPGSSSFHAPQPISRVFALLTIGALREGLRCFPAFRPLQEDGEARGKGFEPSLF
jgi:hypothetical protein